MSLKDTWKNKIDGVDDVLAEDINAIANQAIKAEKEIQTIKEEIGNIEPTLDSIIELQNSLIGGESYSTLSAS